MRALEALPTLFYSPLYLFVWGACWGSFLNVVMYRYPLGKSVVTPPSACPNCGHLIRGYDNIPVLAWFLLRGKCRKCKQPYSIRYALVEAGIGALCAGAAWLHPDRPLAGLALGHGLMALGPALYLLLRYRMLPWYLAVVVLTGLGLYSQQLLFA